MLPTLVDTIELPLYTLIVSETNQIELLIRIRNRASCIDYEATLCQDADSEQLFNSFEGFHDLIEHFRLPDNTSVDFQLQQFIIYANGKFGKNRKYFEIKRLKLKVLDHLTVQSVIQSCEKQAELSPTQLKQFVLCLAKNISKQLYDQRQWEDRYGHDKQIYNEDKLKQLFNQFMEKVEKRNFELEQRLNTYPQIRNQLQKICQLVNEKFSQINLEFSKQLENISLAMAEDRMKLESFHSQIGNCVKFAQEVQQQGFYSGMKANGKRHGTGVYRYSNGNRYSGEWMHGKKTGKGAYRWADGQCYVGDFLNDKIFGYGTYYFSNGNKYEGHFENDEQNGRGEYTWADGERYIGNFVDGLKHGRGVYYFSDGGRYYGQWANDIEEGSGEYTWPNGDRHVGRYLNGSREGDGEYLYTNGDKMKGIFKNGQADGTFITDLKNGGRQQRVYDRGRLVRSKKI